MMKKYLLSGLLGCVVFASGFPNKILKEEKGKRRYQSTENKRGVNTANDKPIMTAVQNYSVNEPLSAINYQPSTINHHPLSHRLTTNKSLHLSYGGLSLMVGAGSVESAVRVSVHSLSSKEMKNLPLSLVNVTKDAEGYRFKPRNLMLKKEADIALAYDEAKIPEGYTAKDIAIFYYDQKSKSWQKLEGSKVEKEEIKEESQKIEENKEKVKSEKLEVKGKITQFSDFIAGIIKLPESPDTSGFTPTSISGLKAADPLSGVQSIASPTANPEGSATTSFAIELPKGRAGMQPSISLQYSNDGGHSWVGQGWNLSLPSVNIDTRWGAPRYDAQKETETYILSGEDLLPNTHRAEWEQRSENKVFYPRREGAFSKIIRKGNHPNNYHWEVSSKSGIISYYGNNANSVSRTANGDNAHWQISEQRDLRGNKVEYEYTSVEGVLYPKAIYYTGHSGEKGKYSVHFITDADLGETPRADVQVSARLGLKQVYNRLLRKIEVKYDNQMVRSYELVYGKGEYEKTLLKEIRQYDADGQLFYANAMSYYNDVRDENGNYTPFGALEKWEVPKDGIDYSFLGITGFSGNPTLAGTSNSTSSGSNFRFGVGSLTGKFNEFTAGGNGGSTQGRTQSKVMLQDLDGDNLPDKIYKKGGGIYYRKNLSSEGVLKFSDEVKQIFIPHLGITHSNSSNYGVDLQLKRVMAGYNRQNSRSITGSYFMDFNGDGLVDFVNGGMVYYNRLVNGVPTFHISSTGTPAPVMSGGSINLSATSEFDREELEKKNPLHDIVRTWTAPYTGTIKVKHQYQLIQDHSQDRRDYKNNDGTPRADGVMLYFQNKGNLLWKERILAEDYALKNKTDNINIRKGEVLYFRVSSVYDGNYDTMHWLPEIEYQDIDAQEKDVNGLSLKTYNAQTDALYPSEKGIIFGKNVQPILEGALTKEATTDKIKLKFYKKNLETNTLQLVAEQEFSEEAGAYDLSGIDLGTYGANDELITRVESDTEVHWQKITSNLKVKYTDTQGNHTEETISIDYNIFYSIDEKYIPQPITASEEGKLKMALSIDGNTPLEQGNQRLNGSLLLTAKQEGKVVGRQRYAIENGLLRENTQASDVVSRHIVTSLPIFIEMNLSDKKIYEALSQLSYQLSVNSENTSGVNTVIARDFKRYKAYVPFEEKQVSTKLGKAYRGWGGFALNGKKAGERIDENLLKDNSENYDSSTLPSLDPNTFNPNDSQYEALEPSNLYFMRLKVQQLEHKKLGLDTDAYLSGIEMKSSRLGENDLQTYLDVSLPVLTGGVSRALSMITESKSNSFSAGVSGGAVSGGGSYSEGDSYVKQTMNDFNGDRFPDFIRGGHIQFTNPRGGVSSQIGYVGDFNHSVTKSFGGSADGSYAHGEAKNSIAIVVTKSASGKLSVATQGSNDAQKASNSASISGNLSTGEDHAEHTYTDMNGDGLADRITAGSIAYNTGYGFLPAESWNFGRLNKGKSLDFGAGLGYSTFSGSFKGGLNYSRSTSNMEIQYLDFTGDGLADKIDYSGTTIRVYQNLGNRFSHQAIEIPKSNRMAENISISYGGGLTFSIPIELRIIGIRFSITAGNSFGSNTNRMEATFTDVDGDGHLDYVLSEDEDDLRVAKSNFRRTNMLKGVTNGAGNSWEIDYEWKAPTYANPNAAWVLKSVKLFDGHTGDGEDYTLSKFEYDNPYYDRRERTFYGYEVVKQEAINPQDNSVLRTSVQEFYNQDYFRKSLLKRAFVLGKENQMLSETLVNYHIANAKTGQDIQPSTLNLPENDATSVFIAPSEEIERSYEGTAYLENKTQKEYDQNGNIIKFIDFGNGNAESQISAQIEYYESQAPYYGGIAKKLEVFDQKGLVRKREAEINPATAELIKVKNYFNANDFAQTDLEYDKFGNLKSITGAENEKGQRAKLVYTYDDATHSHITSIKDQFGYENQMAYDLRFNTPIKTTDRNGETMTYTLDAKGRIATILAPKEAKAGKEYTIAYRYPSIADRHLKAISELQPASSHTLNYDAEHNRNIETYTYADGLGRIVQVKKTASIFKGKGIADEEKHILSGKQIYDALGRVVETYYPTTAPISSVGYQEPSTINHQSSTKTLYDDKDRVIEQIFPDGSKTMVNYQLSMLNSLNINHLQLSIKTTDALGRTSIVYTDAKGQKTKVVQPTGIETKFEYSAIGELRIATDADGHQTLSEYDLLGRRTKLTHPDAGTTLLQYDKASNLIRRQTSQIREEMPEANIVYNYDFNRLQEIQYPKHPDNNVRYHYGSQKEEAGRRGRLWLVEDASGGVEYFYGDMGEVEKEIRTIRISPSEVQTYITEYEYDSWNRIQKMVYPDGERLDFGYNIAGNLTSLMGEKALGKSPNASGEQRIAYIKQQGYDEFEQKVYRRLGNDTETTYTYDPVMRRLSSLVAHRDTPVAPSVFQNNRYSYDLVGNILSVENAINHQSSTINQLGGSSKYTYEYDELNRLIKAKGDFEGTSNKADYELNMQYNRLNGIVQKALQYTLNGQDKGYTLDYEYNNPKHPHAPSSIANNQQPKTRNYSYDGNGNPTYYDEFKGFRSMVWDEENRLRGINDNGRLHLYTYDHTGERALKSSAESSMAVINGLASAVITHTEDYTAYISPYFVVQKGKFTKHYFEGSIRIVSKLGEGTFSHKNTGIMAGGLDYLTRSKKEEEVRQKYIKGLQVPPGPPTQHGIYATPEWMGQPYPSIDWEAISQNQEPPAGWPRYPRFNEPGDVPGPPVQFGEPVTNNNVKAGYGFIPNGVEEKNLYYYHSDHLGSSSYITDKEGQIIQHTEYIAFGEVLVDEHSTSNKMPYLFNGKELDFETGLYYYGARYYDPKTSLWLNTDPLSGYNPILETEHYIDGQHNGGIFNPMNMATYSYTYQNPIFYIDPNGKQAHHSVLLEPNYVSYELRTGGIRTYQKGYKFTSAAVHLINLVTSVNKDYISNTVIKFSKIGSAGASVTLGSSPNQAEITHFYSDKEVYKGTSGKYFNEFLQRNVHEVGHIPQLENGQLAHVSSSVSEYIKNILYNHDWHDGPYSTKEKQADIGEKRFESFNNWIDNTYGKNKLKNLFENKKNTQKDIINRINQWWKAYTTNKFGNSDNANE